MEAPTNRCPLVLTCISRKVDNLSYCILTASSVWLQPVQLYVYHVKYIALHEAAGVLYF